MGCGCRRHRGIGGVHRKTGRVGCAALQIEYLGALPFVCYGAVTGERYKWQLGAAVKLVYECDLASVSAALGGPAAWRVIGALAGVSAPPAPTVIAVNATPMALAWAARFGIDVRTVTGTGKDGRVTAHDVRATLDDAARTTETKEEEG